MALVVKDRVRETSTTAGTGTLTLAGAVFGYQSFSVIGNANTTYYAIVDPTTGAWEVGIGTYTSSGTTLSRDTVLANSLGTTAKIDFAANSKDVFVTYPAGKSVYLDASGNVSPLGTVASGVWQGTAVGISYGGTGQTTQTAAFDALAPTTTKGDIIVSDGADNIRLAVGTNGFVLTADSTQASGVAWANKVSQGTAVTLTNQTSVEFTGIPATAKWIVVSYSGMSTNGTSAPIVQLGTGATPTYTTSGYIGSISSFGGGAQANYGAGLTIVSSPSASDVNNGTMRIANLTGNTWASMHITGFSNTAGGRLGGGSIALAAALTAVRLTTVNGTDQFDAGTVNISWG